MRLSPKIVFRFNIVMMIVAQVSLVLADFLPRGPKRDSAILSFLGATICFVVGAICSLILVSIEEREREELERRLRVEELRPKDRS